MVKIQETNQQKNDNGIDIIPTALRVPNTNPFVVKIFSYFKHEIYECYITPVIFAGNFIF